MQLWHRLRHPEWGTIERYPDGRAIGDQPLALLGAFERIAAYKAGPGPGGPA